MSDSSSEVVVSIAEAARRLGVSPVAVVRHIDEGQLQTRRVDHAKGLHVVLPEALDVVAPEGPNGSEIDASTETSGTGLQAKIDRLGATVERLNANTIGAFREALAALKAELAAKERQLTERDRQIAELRALLAASNPGSKARRGLMRRICAV